MAYLTECFFCKRNTLNYDHDECARNFFKGLQQRILNWHIDNPGKPLPEDIESDFRGEKWQHYQWYLKRVKHDEENARKAEEYRNILQHKLREIGDKEIKEIDPKFKVFVQVQCTLEPTY